MEDDKRLIKLSKHDNRLTEHFNMTATEQNEYFKELNSDKHALELRMGATYEGNAFQLYSIVRKLGITNIVETGVQNGFSSEIFMRALEANGKGTLHSVDSGPTSTDKSHQTNCNTTEEGIPGKNIHQHLKDKYWDLTIGLNYEVLSDVLNKAGDFQLFHHDSDHSSGSVRFEIENVLKVAKKGTLIILHDSAGVLNEGKFTGKLETLFTDGNGHNSIFRVTKGL